MFYQGNINTDTQNPNPCQTPTPTYQQCNQVVQTCNVVDVPHYTNFHTHQINNCIKRHINIPVYSQSSENVYIDEYILAQPMCCNMNQPPVINPNQYQGNIGLNGFNQQTNPFQMPNMTNPFNN